MQTFSKFIGIDWTGAKGKRHNGLAVAECEAGTGPPNLVAPPSGNKRWSRVELTEWLAGLGSDDHVLVGIDSSFAMPFVDADGYFPNENASRHAAQLWHSVAQVCGRDEDFYGGPFVDRYARHYLRPGLRGDLYSRRMRVAENLAVTSGVGPCESVFHLIGPSQVGLSGLSTMAILHELNQQKHIAIWPFDEPGEASLVMVEIYAAAFASLGGHRGKIRDNVALENILQAFGVMEEFLSGARFDDHQADAMVTAAALRHIAHDRKYWKPPALSAMVRRTEGWIFGIV
ncbi:hypothetical protein [Kordiimonas sp.]|uniref:hypothetical protein n=1 Tax=Kordiimonas sp. TaxID=1970157 RepID=UPI003A8EE89F